MMMTKTSGWNKNLETSPAHLCYQTRVTDRKRLNYFLPFFVLVYVVLFFSAKTKKKKFAFSFISYYIKYRRIHSSGISETVFQNHETLKSYLKL